MITETTKIYIIGLLFCIANIYEIEDNKKKCITDNLKNK
jgi:hypothetical protein